MRSNPLSLAVLPLAAGIALHRYTNITLPYIFAFLSFGSILLILLAVQKKRSIPFLLSLLVLLVHLGYLLAYISLDMKGGLVPQYNRWTVCEGRVIDVREGDSSATLVLDKVYCAYGSTMHLIKGRVYGRYKRLYWYEPKTYMPHDIIRFAGTLKMPHGFSNFGGAPFENYYVCRGISATTTFTSQTSIRLKSEKTRLQDILTLWRARINRALDRSFEGGGEKGLLYALLLGSKSSMDEELISDFKTLGIMHLIVVSGLHVGVIAAFIWRLVVLLGTLLSFLIGQRDLRRIASFVSLIFVWLFVFLTGSGIPAVRAGLLFTFYLVGELLGVRGGMLNMLSLAAVVIFVQNPYSIFDPSFQLTFAAVLGIIFSLKYVRARDDDGRRRFFSYLRDLFIVSLGASIFVYPLLAYHFRVVPIFGPFFNIILVPIFTFVITPPTVLGGFISAVSVKFASWIFTAVGAIAHFLLKFIDLVGDYARWSNVRLEFSNLALVASYLFIFLLYFLGAKRFKKLLPLAAIFVAFLGLSPQRFVNVAGKLSVTFLDVGQGAASVLILPNGKVYMIDGGGSGSSNFDIGERVIYPFLKRFGIDSVDEVIITHPHPDHYRGLGFLAEHMKIGVVKVPPFSLDELREEDAHAWKEFALVLERQGIPLEEILGGMEWMDGGVRFLVYSPPQGAEGFDINDRSAVIRVSFGKISFLFTGDMEKKEEALLTSGTDISSTVLAVPHHGSLTSSSTQFVERASPEFAVIQVGAGNTYGFPKDEVVERYVNNGSKVLRTDRDGAISFVSDGEMLEVFRSRDMW